MFYLSLCAIVKNEAPFIHEWLCYHRTLGVEHFYLYDNDSSSSLRELLSGQDDVTVFELAGECRQLDAYNQCHGEYGSSSRWMGMIDIDEFIVPHKVDSLSTLLCDYEEFGGLAVNWQTFGPNGHKNRPSGLVIESYTKKARNWSRMNWHIKTFAQPAKVLRWGQVHFPTYQEKFFSVNENGKPVVSKAFSWPSVKKVQLNHYWTRSEQDWNEKMARGRADIGAYDQKTANKFAAFVKSCTADDRCAVRFASAVRGKLGR